MMCFYNDDYDWIAELEEIDDNHVAEKDIQCDECGGKICAGDTCRYVYQQEHEAEFCEVCEEYADECECEDGEESITCGETFTYHCCKNCRKFLDAIKAVEIDEECPPYASQPCFSELFDSLWQMDRPVVAKYFRRAKQMFTELQTNGYFRRIGKKSFSDWKRISRGAKQ